MTRNLLFVVIFLLSLDIVSAATVYGNLYDLYLDNVNDVIVEINTEPKQTYVSKNGTYSFNVGPGNYEIKAEQYSNKVLVSYAEEFISIKDEGSYVLDLVLFPSLDEDIELGEDINIDVEEDYFRENGSNIILFLSIFIFLLVISLVIFYYLKKKKKKNIEKKEKTEELAKEANGNDLDEIIKIIKEEGGRTTQKEIRKKLPLSEAKISLMIAELEHKGVVEKIKKGRGNIIILKK